MWHVCARNRASDNLIELCLTGTKGEAGRVRQTSLRMTVKETEGETASLCVCVRTCMCVRAVVLTYSPVCTNHNGRHLLPNSHCSSSTDHNLLLLLSASAHQCTEANMSTQSSSRAAKKWKTSDFVTKMLTAVKRT